MEMPIGYYRQHAAVRAAASPSHVGAAVVEFALDRRTGDHRWSCVASDGPTFRDVEVRSGELGPWQRLPAPVVEEAVERFAGTLPRRHRLYHLVNANPIHLGRDGVARD
jgi:hypothetical protein